MNDDMLKLECAEWRDIAATCPDEMEVVVEMLIAAGEELCYDKAA